MCQSLRRVADLFCSVVQLFLTLRSDSRVDLLTEDLCRSDISLFHDTLDPRPDTRNFHLKLVCRAHVQVLQVSVSGESFLGVVSAVQCPWKLCNRIGSFRRHTIPLFESQAPYKDVLHGWGSISCSEHLREIVADYI